MHVVSAFRRTADGPATAGHYVLAVLVAVILALGVTACDKPSLQQQGNTFRVDGWTPPASAPPGGWPSVLAVYAGTGDVPPLSGTYSVEGRSLVFRPAYPLAAGVHYRAVFHGSGGGLIETNSYVEPLSTPSRAHVTAIYPTADVLPSNQLRLYIYFSAPMSRGEAEQRIHVLDANDKPLPAVFLPGQELWDPQNRRLTMTFDPGRIKRDLVSNRSMGPPIVEGRTYTILIDREWHDANGVAMAEPFKKMFRGGPAVRRPPDPTAWTITAPAANSREPLAVGFGRPMNYTLLQRMLKVSSPTGEVAGAIEVAHQESEWRFTPAQPWVAGGYTLVVDTSLEDLAGNKIGQPFDIDVFDKVTEKIATSTTSRRFDIR